MNKFKFYFILSLTVFVLFSCNKSDDSNVVAIRDLKTQYNTDNELIEKYLKEHYIKSVINLPGESTDQDIVIEKITNENTQPQIWSLLDVATYPKLKRKLVEQDGFTYNLYYLILREGDVVEGKTPSRVDNVLVSYDGSYMSKDSEPKRFEYIPFPNAFFDLGGNVISGWKEIIPLFKSGLKNQNPGNPDTYSNFGAGVMFIPSGLGYFNQAQQSIPSYSPLIFSFKLYDVSLSDQDGDKINSNDEDVNGNGIFTDDDTDGDGISNYRDQDDDGDGYITKEEIKNSDGIFYNFADIPLCPEGNGNKRHLDKKCHD